MRWFGPKLKPVREIRSKENVLHFRRWQILALPWGTLYLHHIARADQDEHLHNHPWNFTSLILKGGYVEIRRCKSFESNPVAVWSLTID